MKVGTVLAQIFVKPLESSDYIHVMEISLNTPEVSALKYEIDDPVLIEFGDREIYCNFKKVVAYFKKSDSKAEYSTVIYRFYYDEVQV